MASLLSLERFLPPYRYPQREVTKWVREWLLEPRPAGEAQPGDEKGERLLSVYETAGAAPERPRRGSRTVVQTMSA